MADAAAELFRDERARRDREIFEASEASQEPGSQPGFWGLGSCTVNLRQPQKKPETLKAPKP